MTLRAATCLALALPISGRQHVEIPSNGQIRTSSGWSVVRSVNKRASFDEQVSRANCVAWKDARFVNYPHDGLYQYQDFASRADADAFFAGKFHGELATIQYESGAEVNTTGSYFTESGYNMALVCGISLNMTTPWGSKAACAPGEVVDTMDECQIAGPFLGFRYSGHVSKNDGTAPPGCYSASGVSFYNMVTDTAYTTGGGTKAPICRVTTTTTTPLPTTLYAGHLSKLQGFTSAVYDGLRGSVSLETTAHGVGTEVRMSGRHNAATRAGLRSRVFHAHLHAAPCASNGGGHYQNPNGDGTATSVNENWPKVTCDDNGDCFGRAHNAWAPRLADLAAGMSIVVHDTPNAAQGAGSKAFCADLTLCPSTNLHACLSATAQLIAEEPEPPVVLKAATTVTTTVFALKEPSTTAAPAALKEELHDANEFCGDWASKGECDKNPGYMKKACKASCNQHKAAPQQPVLAQKK